MSQGSGCSGVGLGCAGSRSALPPYNPGGVLYPPPKQPEPRRQGSESVTCSSIKQTLAKRHYLFKNTCTLCTCSICLHSLSNEYDDHVCPPRHRSPLSGLSSHRLGTCLGLKSFLICSTPIAPKRKLIDGDTGSSALGSAEASDDVRSPDSGRAAAAPAAGCCCVSPFEL